MNAFYKYTWKGNTKFTPVNKILHKIRQLLIAIKQYSNNHSISLHYFHNYCIIPRREKQTKATINYTRLVQVVRHG